MVRTLHEWKQIFIYNKVAEHLKYKDKMVIAKIDSTDNKLKTMKITSFPTFKFFKKDTIEAVGYNGSGRLKK